MIVKDLTPFFIEARKQASSWSLKATNLLLSISQVIPEAKIDWDLGAGENWASIIVGEDSIGIIHSDVPIAFFLDKYYASVADLMANNHVKLIAVADFEEECFKLDSNQAKKILPGIRMSSAIKLDILSIADLWWATI